MVEGDATIAQDTPLTVAQVATLCGCDVAVIERLVALGHLSTAGLSSRDVNGVRLMMSFESAGIGLDIGAPPER